MASDSQTGWSRHTVSTITENSVWQHSVSRACLKSGAWVGEPNRFLPSSLAPCTIQVVREITCLLLVCAGVGERIRGKSPATPWSYLPLASGQHLSSEPPQLQRVAGDSAVQNGGGHGAIRNGQMSTMAVFTMVLKSKILSFIWYITVSFFKIKINVTMLQIFVVKMTHKHLKEIHFFS